MQRYNVLPVPHIVGDDDEEEQNLASPLSPIKCERSATPKSKTNHEDSSDTEDNAGSSESSGEINDNSNDSSSDNDWSSQVSCMLLSPEEGQKHQGLSAAMIRGFQSSTLSEIMLKEVGSGKSAVSDHNFNGNNNESLLTDMEIEMSQQVPQQHSPFKQLSEIKLIATNNVDIKTFKEAPAPDQNKDFDESYDIFMKSLAVKRLKSSCASVDMPRSENFGPAGSRSRNAMELNGEFGQTTTEDSIALRVARRQRGCNRPEMLKSPSMKLAKPLDITQYFCNVSANLVRRRISLVSFNRLITRMDRLVDEAIYQDDLK